MVLLRGDHRLNEIKLRNALGAGFRQAGAEEIAAEIGPVGYIGPVGAKVPVIKDAAIAGDSYVCGANQADTHLRGVQPGRDFEFEELDVRTVEAGDTAPAAARSRSSRRSRSATSSSSAPATRSRSAPPTSTRTGQEQPIVMGSYGIGPARILAAAIEQRADERGIVWPRALAPWERPPRLPRQGRRARARGGRPALRGAARGRHRGPLRRARRRGGREADRRRAARLPAADRRRPPRSRQRRRRGLRARLRRRARAARGGGRQRGRWRSSTGRLDGPER